MALQKNDFIEIEFTAKIKDTGEVFDSNIPEELEKLGNGQNKEQAKPFIFPLGNEMFVKGVDEFLIGKSEPSEDSKKSQYTIELTPENAFGQRDSKMIQKIPSNVFRQQKVNPAPGQVFNFDGRIGKVLAVSGGRVIVDFNNPVAGKDVVYDLKIKRKINDINEKIKAIIDILFKKEFDFSVDEKNKKITIKSDANYKNFIELFKEKFKEILGYNLEVEEIAEESKTEGAKPDKKDSEEEKDTGEKSQKTSNNETKEENKK